MFLDFFTYYLYVILTFFIIYILIAKRDYIVKHKKEVLFFILALLLYTQYRRYGSRLFLGSFTYQIQNFPIHFCRMSALMTLVYLFTRNKYIMGFVFFQSGLGFLSVLVPDGLLLELPQDWRNLTFMWDHFVLAIMPVFLIFIMGYRPNKKDFKISMIYSLVVPLLVLPIAIATDYNAYYVLDGVFVKDIFGDNQLVIISVMLVLLVMYNYLMLFIGNWLVKISNRREGITSSLFNPIYPWALVIGYIVIGISIGIFFVRSVPDYLIDIPDSYIGKPHQIYNEELAIYHGIKDGEVYYFVESIVDKDLIVMNTDGSSIVYNTIENGSVVYFSTLQIDVDQVIIVIIDNIGEEDEESTAYAITIENDYDDFMNEYENKLTIN